MEFRNLKTQYQKLHKEIDEQIHQVIESGRFISGSQVSELETKLAGYVGVKHCITCANGTDALTLALMAWGIGGGDAVFVPDFTFFSSGECPAGVGATPIFVDVQGDTYNLDPVKLEEAIVKIEQEGELVPKVVVAVDLFGLPADYSRIRKICECHHLLLLEDGAQGFGGSIGDKKTCSFGDISTTSFFPAKPLGCYGDGGAVFTDNDEWAALIRSLAVHGKSKESKYDNVRLGLNSRLDTLQAGILLAKFEAFYQYELKAVNKVAKKYTDALDSCELVCPYIPDGMYSSWAQYTVQLPDGIDREMVQSAMKNAGVPTMVYYMKPMHLQKAFAGSRSAKADCPVTDRICKQVLSLPMHPYLEDDEQSLVIASLLKAIRS